MPPIFFKAKSVESLVEYMKQVASAAPNTPFLYYHFPDITGTALPVNKLLKQGLPLIPTLVGAKFTGYDLGDYGRCLALENGAFDILYGYDTQFLASCSLGGDSGIGASYSFCGKYFNEMIECMKNPTKENLTKTQAIQLKVNRLFEVLEQYESWIAAYKILMRELKGLDFGGVRAPQKPFCSNDVQDLVAK